jgi:DNA-binding NarL/FixJ family response regulator
MQKIFICEDHNIIVDGLKLLLKNSKDFKIIGHSGDGNDLIAAIDNEKPDILLLDLNLKDTDGLTLLEQIRQTNKTLKIVILTMYQDYFLIERAQKSGANAYLQKNVTGGELIKTLRQLETDNFYLSKTLQQETERKKSFRDQFVNKMKLTKRELELIPLLATGKNSSQIASQLDISSNTIDTHRKNIFRKLEINSMIELVNFAHENNLV